MHPSRTLRHPYAGSYAAPCVGVGSAPVCAPKAWIPICAGMTEELCARIRPKAASQRFAGGKGLRGAWINDQQRGGLENGVNRASPSRHLVEPALARLPEELPAASPVCFPVLLLHTRYLMLRSGHKKPVIPAQAGIHSAFAEPPQHGFPPARE